MENKLTIDHNSCIISSNLLDELDYVIGGYGKPTVEFIFNFNAFVEAYLLSSSFILTQKEFEHCRITRKVLFPNGRPIFDMLTKNKNLSAISGIGNNITQCVYVDKVEKNDEETAQKAINAFCNRDSKRIIQNFILSDFTNPIQSVKTYSVGFAGKHQPEFGSKNQVLIGETTNQPFEIVKSFFDSITNHNVQAALPVFTYQEQLSELNKKAISKEIYTKLSELQGQTVKDAEKHFGTELQIIPPLVSIVLSKTNSIEKIPEVLDEIRADFTEFRICCENFEKRLNEAETIKEQVEAVKEYKKFWAALVKKYSDESTRLMFRFLDIAKDSNYENSIDGMIDNQSVEDIFKDMNLGKVAGKAGFLAWDKIKEKRILNKFKGVVNLWSLLENSPTIDKQIKDVERVFKTTIDRNRVATAKNYLNKIKKVPNNG
jgi:hypothetical protein